MRFRRVQMGGVGLAVALATGAAATPVLWVSESFSYAEGSIEGAAGGSGWTGSWFNPYSQQPLKVSAEGALFHDGSSIIEAAGRALGQRFSGEDFSSVYLTFSVQWGSQSGAGTPTLRLLDTTLASNTVQGALGNNGYAGTYGILGPGLAAGANSTVPLETAAHLLYAIDYEAGLSRLWIGASPWDIEALPDSVADATYAGAPSFDRLDLYVRQLSAFDDLAIHAVAIPEPGALAWVLGWALGVARALRRRPVRRSCGDDGR